MYSEHVDLSMHLDRIPSDQSTLNSVQNTDAAGCVSRDMNDLQRPIAQINYFAVLDWKELSCSFIEIVIDHSF